MCTFLWAMMDSVGLVLMAAGAMSFFALGVWATLYTYTPETYPTTLRTTGMGSASGWARVGGFAAPYAGGVLIGIALGLALTVFAISFLLAALVVALFAFETKDRDLADVLGEHEEQPAPRERAPEMVATR